MITNVNLKARGGSRDPQKPNSFRVRGTKDGFQKNDSFSLLLLDQFKVGRQGKRVVVCVKLLKTSGVEILHLGILVAYG